MNPKRLDVRNVGRLRQIAELRPFELLGTPYTIAFRPGTTVLASAGRIYKERSVNLVDYDTGQPAASLPLGKDDTGTESRYLDFSSCGRYLASCGGRSVSIWDLQGLDLMAKHPLRGSTTSCARFCASGEKEQILIVEPHHAWSLFPWSTATGRGHLSYGDQYSLPFGGRDRVIDIAPTGERVAVFEPSKETGPNSLTVWNLRTGRAECGCSNVDLGLSSDPQSVCFDGPGQLLAIGGLERIRVLSLPHGNILSVLPIEDLGILDEAEPSASSLAFGPDGRVLVVGVMCVGLDWAPDVGESIPFFYYQWTVFDWERRLQLADLRPGGRRIAISEDGCRLALLCDGRVEIWSP